MASSPNSVRYALYLAPSVGSELWRFGCDAIGRDASTGARYEGFALEGYPPDVWRSMTSDPRRYGFHATLKAPFRLRADLDLRDLTDRLAEFAGRFAAFEAGELKVGSIPTGDGRAFIALRPKRASKELRAFEASVVRAFEPMRAPLSEADRERRSAAGLSPRQAYYLDAWGYPYVLDEFRLHFTLTNAILDADRVARALAWEFGVRVASHALRVEALALFGESEPGGDFRILRQFPLGRSAPARRSSSRALAPSFLD